MFTIWFGSWYGDWYGASESSTNDATATLVGFGVVTATLTSSQVGPTQEEPVFVSNKPTKRRRKRISGPIGNYEEKELEELIICRAL
jgi:hypothetical protein